MSRTRTTARSAVVAGMVALAAGLAVVPAASPAAASVELGGDVRLSDMGPAGAGYTVVRTRVAHGSSGFLAVWEGTDRTGLAGKAEVYGQLVSAVDGTEIAPNDVLVGTAGAPTDATTDAVSPDVAYNSVLGEFLVVYAADDTVDPPGQVITTFEIYAQRVSAAGALVGSPLRVSTMGSVDTSGSYDAFAPAVAFNATANEYLVVWSGDDDTAPLVNGEEEIFARRLAVTGGALGTVGAQLRVSDMGPDSSSQYDAADAAVAWNSTANEYLVTWSGNDAAANAFPIQVFGQRLSGTGAEVGANDFLVGSSGDEAYTPAVTYSPAANEYLVVWSGDNGAANRFDIFGQRVSAAGAELGGDTNLSNVGNDSFDARTPAVAWDAFEGEYEVVWAGDAAAPLGLGDEDVEVYLGRLSSSLGTAGATRRISAMGGATTSTQTPDIAYSNTAVTSSLVVWAAENQGVTAAGESEAWGQLLAPEVDLVVVKTRLSAANPGPGDPVQYQIVVTNLGPATAAAVRVSDTLPAAVTGTTATLPVGATQVSPGPGFVWDLGSVPSGQSRTITLSGVVAAGVTNGQVVTNTATVTQTVPHVDPNLANNNGSASFTVDLPPTVTVEQAAGQADPTNASPVAFTVTFSETVTGFEPDDVVLGGSAGATTAAISGSGPTYTVSVSGMTSDGTVAASIPANRVADSAGKGNLASTSTDNVVTRDTTPPTVTLEQAFGQADPTDAQPILFTATFTEDVDPITSADVQLSGTAGLGSPVVSVTGGPAVYDIEVSGITSDGTVTATIPAGATTDLAGNGNAASTSTDNTVRYDTAAPTLTVSQAAGQADPTATSPILFTAAFSEEVTGFDKTDVQLSGTADLTAAAATVSGGPTSYTISVAGMAGTGTVVASVPDGAAVDLANKPSTTLPGDNSVTFDATRPTVTVGQEPGQADPTNTEPVRFRLTFSEPVSAGTGQVTIGGTALAGTVSVDSVGPEPATGWVVSLSDINGSGTLTVSVPAGGFVDATGNSNLASTATDDTVTFDVTAPELTFAKADTQDDPTNASPVRFTATFDEEVTGFDGSDVAIGGTAGPTTVVVDGGPSVYTVEVSGMTGGGTVTASVGGGAANDLAGNASTAPPVADTEVTYDPVAPTVTVNQAAGQADPTNTSPVEFTVVFSEPVTGFDADDVDLGGTAGATTAVVSGTGPTYSVAVSGMTAAGTVVASVRAGAGTDAAGNASAASTSTDNVVDFDAGAPTVTVEQAASQADPTNASPVTFTVTFSEPVTGFVAADVVLGGTAGATTAVVSGTGATYSVAVSGMTSDGTVTASLAPGAASDAVGNPSTASTSTDNVVTFDTTAPTVTVNQAAGQADPALTTPILFTVVFSEPVTGFTASDVALSAPSGATATVTGGPSLYTVSVGGMRRGGPVTVTVPAGAATDAAGNASAASTSTDNRVVSGRRLEIGSPGGPISITVSDGAELLTFSTAEPSPRPPARVRFPYGALSFSAEADPGSLVTFTITLPRPAVSYYKLVGGAWSVFDVQGDTGATVAGNVVTVTIRDNGRGDADPRPGIVADPGAPAEVNGTLPPTGSDPSRAVVVGVGLVAVGALLARRRLTPTR